MEYTIKELAELAGVSTRTLRYYDQIGLLAPARVNQAGYRIYGRDEVDALQQILLYKEMGMELAQIKEHQKNPNFDKVRTMEEHLKKLLTKKKQLEIMISNVSKTIEREKGLITMTDQEKFEGLKRETVKVNEEKYGDEIRARYGGDTIEASNKKMMNLTEEDYAEMERIGDEIRRRLETAVESGNLPAGPEGKEIAQLHKTWLEFTWPSYSKEAHVGLAQMYAADERFKNYYDSRVDGCAKFLGEAVKAHI